MRTDEIEYIKQLFLHKTQMLDIRLDKLKHGIKFKDIVNMLVPKIIELNEPYNFDILPLELNEKISTFLSKYFILTTNSYNNIECDFHEKIQFIRTNKFSLIINKILSKKKYDNVMIDIHNYRVDFFYDYHVNITLKMFYLSKNDLLQVIDQLDRKFVMTDDYLYEMCSKTKP